MRRPLCFLGFCCALALVGRACAQEPQPIAPYEAHKKIGEICAVDLRVVAVGTNPDGKVRLQSAESVIDPNNITIILSKDIADKVGPLKDKLIRVTGKLTSRYQRPEIEIVKAEDLKVIPESPIADKKMQEYEPGSYLWIYLVSLVGVALLGVGGYFGFKKMAPKIQESMRRSRRAKAMKRRDGKKKRRKSYFPGRIDGPNAP